MGGRAGARGASCLSLKSGPKLILHPKKNGEKFMPHKKKGIIGSVEMLSLQK
jgi:hypothetical protein